MALTKEEAREIQREWAEEENAVYEYQKYQKAAIKEALESCDCYADFFDRVLREVGFRGREIKQLSEKLQGS